MLYVGVTNNLLRRVWDHKSNITKGSTKKYFIDKLVYFEETISVIAAIQREKRLKKWNRKWKEALINSRNPEWKDLVL